METVNEELRSTNEELSRTNERLREREEALHHTNALLNAILASLRAGVIVVGADFTVEIWNERAEKLWGLRAKEVLGKPLTSLDIGLPVGELADPIRASLGAGGERRELTVDAVNRRGRGFRCRVVVDPLPAGTKAGAVCVLMEEVEGQDNPGEAEQT